METFALIVVAFFVVAFVVGTAYSKTASWHRTEPNRNPAGASRAGFLR